MSVARIICTVIEDALQLALPLSERFDRVEIVEPGQNQGEAEPDFEINLEYCSLGEALASVAMLPGRQGSPVTACRSLLWNYDYDA